MPSTAFGVGSRLGAETQYALLGADLWHFGVLTSRMHMAWLRHIGGRLKSDYLY
jgi:hypothetical protein